MKVLNADQMRAADTHAIQDLGIPSLVLMENAATCVTRVILERNPVYRPVLVVCGKGNNGGDGMAVSRMLKEAGWNPILYLAARPEDLKADPAKNWRLAQDCGVEQVTDPDVNQLEEHLGRCDLVVDALFGTGLTKPLEGIYSRAVQMINHAGREVIAIDVPSGLSSDTGEMLGPAIRARQTVALAALKFCHVLSPACKMCGDIFVADIGIPVDSHVQVTRSDEIRPVLPRRSLDHHKGTFGHALIIAGSTGKSGAAYMTGKAALKAGAGLVTIASPSAVQPVIASLGPEIMTQMVGGDPHYFDSEALAAVLPLLNDRNAVAIGPGIGRQPETLPFLQKIVTTFQGPLLIDADGLNLVSEDKSILASRTRSSTVLTPHPGEMSRLMGIPVSEVQKNRLRSAQQLATDTGSVVVLKGYRTVISDPAGRTWINLTGGPSLASAGTGDILTGLITGYLCQKLTPLEAALTGVYAHGLTANIFEARYPHQCLNAMEILQNWNETVQAIRSEQPIEDEYIKIHFRL